MNIKLTKSEVYEKAVKLFENGDYKKAEELYDKILDNDPLHASTLHAKGVLLRSKNQLHNSIEYLKKALEINPKNLQYWLTLSDTYFRLNEFKLAKKVIQDAKNIGHEDEKINIMNKLINDELSKMISGSLNFSIPNEETLTIQEAFKLANEFYETNQFRKTIAYADFVLKEDPNNINMIKAKTNSLALFKEYDLVIEILTDFIEKGFNDSEIMNNLGTCYQEMGLYEDSTEQFKKSLDKEENSLVRDNLGESLIRLGKIEEGIQQIQIAVESQPSNILLRQHLVEVYIKNKDFIAAMEECKKSLKYEISNQTLLDYYKKLFTINKGNDQNKYDIFDEKIGYLLLEQDSNFTSLPIELILNKLPKELKKFKKRDKKSTEEKIYSSEKVIEFLNDKTLLLLLKNSLCVNEELEKVLSLVRFDFLNIVQKGYSNYLNFDVYIDFIKSIALQSYNNEFLWNISKDEILLINELVKKFNDLEDNKIFNLYLLSAYSKLNEIKLSGLSLINNREAKEIIDIHLNEDEKIDNLKKKIKKFEEIENLSSIKVRNQYEKNLYPRWREIIDYKEMTIQDFINLEIMPNKGSYPNDSPDILIAGCGTGKELVTMAKIFKKAKFLAIDLSVNSLAYAKMKTIENNVDNVEFLQCDLLSLKKLNRKFDIIISSGVIHHMENPELGFKILSSCINKNGLMRLGLNSKLARRNIINIQKSIKDIVPKNITNDSIRAVRDFIFSLDSKSSFDVKNMRELYCLSSVRGLMMNFPEKSFSINEIKSLLNQSDLTFVGFTDPKVKIIYKEEFPDDRSMLNLDNWAKFEEINNSAFIGMYQFWVTK